MEATSEQQMVIDGAFDGLREMLAADGYALSWKLRAPDEVDVAIAAGPEACADCLVPQRVMEAMMTQALEPTPFRVQGVTMPAEH